MSNMHLLSTLCVAHFLFKRLACSMLLSFIFFSFLWCMHLSLVNAFRTLIRLVAQLFFPNEVHVVPLYKEWQNNLLQNVINFFSFLLLSWLALWGIASEQEIGLVFCCVAIQAYLFCRITNWSIILTVSKGSWYGAAAFHLLGNALSWLNLFFPGCSCSHSGSNVHSSGTYLSTWGTTITN